MAEQVFYSDSAVRVTSTEATFGQIRLPIDGIKSARMVAVPPRRNYLCNIALVLLVLACLFSTTMRWFPANGDFTMSYVLLDMSRVLIWFMGIASLLVWLQGTRFIVKVAGDFGEKNVVIARRLRYARQVVWALNAAVMSRAGSPGRVGERVNG